MQGLLDLIIGFGKSLDTGLRHLTETFLYALLHIAKTLFQFSLHFGKTF